MTIEITTSGVTEEKQKISVGNQPSKIDWISATILFGFPLFAVSVRHWASTSFFLLCLLGLLALVVERKRIFKDVSWAEWAVVGLVVGFFLSFLATSFYIGWDGQAERALGTEARFLLFVPLYLLVRQNPLAFNALVLGSFFAVFVNFGFVFYEVEYLHRAQVHLAYSSLYVGPVTVILAAIAVFGFRLGPQSVRFLVRMLVIAAALYVAMQTARSAIVGVIILGILAIVWLQSRFRCLTFLFFVMLGIGAIVSNDFAKNRVGDAYAQLIDYLEYELNANEGAVNKKGGGSIGTRLEMIKAAQYVLEKAPWLGLGRYHYTDFVRQQVELGEIHKSVSQHAHPHNMFLAALFFKGIVGVLIISALIVFSLAYFWRRRAESSGVSLVGAAFLLVFFSSQLTESAGLIKGNFIAVMLIALAVLFSAAATHVESQAPHEPDE